jgi:hypothetical protein
MKRNRRTINGEQINNMRDYCQAPSKSASTCQFRILRQGSELTIGRSK